MDSVLPHDRTDETPTTTDSPGGQPGNRATDRPARRGATPAPGVGDVYRAVLEARVHALEAQLDRKERQVAEIRRHYEAVLADVDDRDLAATWQSESASRR